MAHATLFRHQTQLAFSELSCSSLSTLQHCATTEATTAVRTVCALSAVAFYRQVASCKHILGAASQLLTSFDQQQAASAAACCCRAAGALEEAAREYKMRTGRPFVLVIDAVDRLADHCPDLLATFQVAARLSSYIQSKPVRYLSATHA